MVPMASAHLLGYPRGELIEQHLGVDGGSIDRDGEGDLVTRRSHCLRDVMI
jgi:agmatine/peptidylarginine deiminase